MYFTVADPFIDYSYILYIMMIYSNIPINFTFYGLWSWASAF